MNVLNVQICKNLLLSAQLPKFRIVQIIRKRSKLKFNKSIIQVEFRKTEKRQRILHEFSPYKIIHTGKLCRRPWKKKRSVCMRLLLHVILKRALLLNFIITVLSLDFYWRPHSLAFGAVPPPSPLLISSI